jgi:HK97 family phage portal protein
MTIAERAMNGIRKAAAGFAGWVGTVRPFAGAFRTYAGSKSRLWDGMDPAIAIKESEFLAVCVTRILDAAMFAEWKIIEVGTDKEVPDSSPDVRLLKQPNPFMNWHEMIELIVMHMLTTKGGYLCETKVSLWGSPMELWPLYPKAMFPVRDPETFINHWEYRQMGKVQEIPTDRVHWFKYADPNDAWNGMGRVQSAERMFNIDIAMNQYVENFFLNNATPGAVFESDQNLVGDQKKQAQAALDEMHGGFWNSFKSLVLPKGMKYNPVQNNPKEVDFNLSKERIGKSIGALFGVGPVMMGRVENSNKAAASTEVLLFQKLVLKPLLRRLEAKIDVIVKKFNPIHEFQFEKVNDDDDEVKSQIMHLLVGDGVINRNEFREKFGFEAISVENGYTIEQEKAMDSFLVPQNLLPIEQAAAEPAPIPAGLLPFAGPGGKPPKPGEPAAPGTSPAGDGLPKPGKPGDPAAPQPAAAQPEPPARPAKSVNTGRETKSSWRRGAQLRLHRIATRAKGHSARVLMPKLRSFWHAEGARVAHAIEHRKDAAAEFLKAMKLTGAEREKALHDDPLSLSQHQADFNRMIRPFYVEGLQEDYAVTADFLGITRGSFGPSDHAFTARVGKLASKVTAVSETTRDKLDAVIREGVDLGLSPSDIANGVPDLGYAGIRGLFDEFSGSRSQMIGATESSRVYDQAATYAYSENGVLRCDVVGCQDDEIMPGQSYGCLSTEIPIDESGDIDFHPRHTGTIVPAADTYLAHDRFLTKALASPRATIDRMPVSPVGSRHE